MVQRILLGNLGDGYGLRVSKPGFDVTTAAKGDLLVDSVASGFLRQRAFYTLSFSSISTQYITHNLGVIPIVLYAFITGTSSSRLATPLTVWSSSTQVAVAMRTAQVATVTLQLLTEIV